jgi:hypothetical protein
MIQKFNDSMIQRFKDSKIQRFKDSRIRKFKDSKIFTLSSSKGKDSKIQEFIYIIMGLLKGGGLTKHQLID